MGQGPASGEVPGDSLQGTSLFGGSQFGPLPKKNGQFSIKNDGEFEPQGESLQGDPPWSAKNDPFRVIFGRKIPDQIQKRRFFENFRKRSRGPNLTTRILNSEASPARVQAKMPHFCPSSSLFWGPGVSF